MAEPPSFAVTADVVLLTERRGKLHVLLVRRSAEPFPGRWALPGKLVDVHEDVEVAAYRELGEQTGVDTGQVLLAQLGTYSAPGRDPRGRVVSVAWWAQLPEEAAGAALEHGTDDAPDAAWVPVAHVLDGPAGPAEEELAFDHAVVLADAVTRARAADPALAIAVRFDLPDPAALADFDALVADLLPGVRADEPGTLAYVVHAVEGEPLARVFYESYAPGGHTDHEQRGATAAFLARVREISAGTRVELLRQVGAVRR